MFSASEYWLGFLVTIIYVAIMSFVYYRAWYLTGELIKSIPTWKNTNKPIKWFIYWVISLLVMSLIAYTGIFVLQVRIINSAFDMELDGLTTGTGIIGVFIFSAVVIGINRYIKNKISQK